MMLIAYLPLMTASITASAGPYLIDTGHITILFSHFVPILFIFPSRVITYCRYAFVKVTVAHGTCLKIGMV